MKANRDNNHVKQPLSFDGGDDGFSKPVDEAPGNSKKRLALCIIAMILALVLVLSGVYAAIKEFSGKKTVIYRAEVMQQISKI